MPKIEILAYSPTDMDDFIKFCIEGIQVDGVFTKDEDGREIRGVMSWLHGREVRAAQFFHTPKNHPLTLFMALIQKHEDEDDERPWFRRMKTTPPKIILEPEIAGIDKQLRVDGQIGTLEEFLPLDKLLDAVEHKPDIDAKFAAGRERVRDALKRLEEDPTGRKRFLAALRSDKGSRPTEVFEELKFSLRD